MLATRGAQLIVSVINRAQHGFEIWIYKAYNLSVQISAESGAGCCFTERGLIG